MTLTAIYLEIPGNPLPLKRPRFTHGRSWQMNPATGKASFRTWTYNSQEKEMKNVQQQMKLQYRFAPVDEPLAVFYEFEMPIPKYWSEGSKKLAIKGNISHTKRPDVSNLIKFYEDCMNGIIYEDDSSIIKSEAIKRYSKIPKTRIWIKSFSDTQIRDMISEDMLYVA